MDYHLYDVFTEQPYAGNPLAIVEAADALSTDQMQRIAAEFNLSETIFIRAPADPANTARVRIFFPTAEIPFAGHPTIGCALHLATQQMAGQTGDWQVEIKLEEQAGLVPVQVARRAGQLQAELTAPVLPHALPFSFDTAKLANALNIAPNQIGFGSHRPGHNSGGPDFIFVPVADLAALSKASPTGAAWQDLCAATGCNSAYLYTPNLNQGGTQADYHARMFAPGDGIAEDPATGSASAILAAQFLASGTLANGETTITLLQGAQMGRPSQIRLRIIAQDGQLQQVCIAGSAVAIGQGQLHALPPA